MDKMQLQNWEKRARRRLSFREDPARMTRIDWLVMLAITLIYAAVAFFNLGSTDVPQTFYTAQTQGEQIVITFEQPETFSMIKYDGLLGSGTFSVYYSMDEEGYTQLMHDVTSTDDDGAEYTETVPYTIDYDPGRMYEWQFMMMPQPVTAQYVMLDIDMPGAQILELAFCDETGAPVAVASVQSLDPEAERGNDASKMFDEQGLVPIQTSHMTEMYFDEIYHARTAYEHIHHIAPYEITHPPLGKILISVGIRLFGMNPFGWRCIGTLFGVLMLPLMYLFAKRLFKKPLFAFIPTFLMAVDFMHFAQTRIATIDSYSVFFIMLMMYFMYIYTEQNYNRQPLKSTLWPLALSGVAFGLGAATKWLCIYAGIGLAVLFFIQMGQRYMEYLYAKGVLARKDESGEAMPQSKRTLYETLVQDYTKNTLITLMWCVLFFIVVPLIIYYLSYIPYMNVAEYPYDFAGILGNQEYMLNYHSVSVLGSDPHPCATPWYEWPADITPMFFFQGQGYPDGVISRIASFGNPAVWWGGGIAVISLIVIRLVRGPFGRRTMFISIAALSQYLPWVIVPRETYIYHFFATVPFMLLLMGVFGKFLIERTRHGKKFVFIYLGVCLVLFVLFYPGISGLPVPWAYANKVMYWMPKWPFW
jgi:hypothetical protein